MDEVLKRARLGTMKKQATELLDHSYDIGYEDGYSDRSLKFDEKYEEMDNRRLSLEIENVELKKELEAAKQIAEKECDRITELETKLNDYDYIMMNIRKSMAKENSKNKSLLAVKPDGTPYIYAVDFDGTLSLDAEWPKIGKPNTELMDALRAAKADGAKLILWTNRLGSELRDAVNWCAWHCLAFDAINDDVEQIKKAWNYVTGRKIYADYYIDDHNMEVFR